MNEYATERQYRRYSLSVPVEFQGVRGITRNISVGGIYFESVDGAITAGSAIRFFLVFQEDDKSPLRLECDGTVVRVDQLSGGRGVAATIDCFESIVAAMAKTPRGPRPRAERDH